MVPKNVLEYSSLGPRRMISCRIARPSSKKDKSFIDGSMYLLAINVFSCGQPKKKDVRGGRFFSITRGRDFSRRISSKQASYFSPSPCRDRWTLKHQVINLYFVGLVGYFRNTLHLWMRFTENSVRQIRKAPWQYNWRFLLAVMPCRLLDHGLAQSFAFPIILQLDHSP